MAEVNTSPLGLFEGYISLWVALCIAKLDEPFFMLKYRIETKLL